MTLELELVSTETIKPSSPTPPHLSTFNLSRLDQLTPPWIIPLILFYSAGDTTTDTVCRTDRLKKSLSETLTQFYPLAGRICDDNDNQVIHCNDEGVTFAQARVHGRSLNQVVSHPEADELEQLVPKDDNFHGKGPKVLLSIQVTIFEECGGMALGLCLSHKLFDASSLSTFLNNRAAVARGHLQDIVAPNFDLTSLFPPKVIPVLPPLSKGATEEKIARKRFVFNAGRLSAVRAKCVGVGVQHPTRVEAVSALLWKHVMTLQAVKESSSSLSSVMTFSVNVRGRMVPPLCKSSIGNCVVMAMASSTIDRETGLDYLVAQMRGALGKIDSEYVRKLQVDGGLWVYLQSLMDVLGSGLQAFGMVSWCRFAFYQADFGWGEPVWATRSVTDDGRNNVTLLDTKCGTGVEAWLSLEEEDMARFECEPEIIAFTSSMVALS